MDRYDDWKTTDRSEWYDVPEPEDVPELTPEELAEDDRRRREEAARRAEVPYVHDDGAPF